MIAACWIPLNHNKFPQYHIWKGREFLAKGRALCGMRLPGCYDIADEDDPANVKREAICKRCEKAAAQKAEAQQ